MSGKEVIRGQIIMVFEKSYNLKINVVRGDGNNELINSAVKGGLIA